MEWYPPVSFYFEVKFSGLGSDTSFLEVSGLERSMEFKPLEEGGSQRTHNVPLRVSYKNLILKRGVFEGSELTKWCDDAFDYYDIQLKDIEISLFNEQGYPVASWSVRNAYPIKWSISNFNAMKNEVAIESLELAYESFKRTI